MHNRQSVACGPVRRPRRTRSGGLGVLLGGLSGVVASVAVACAGDGEIVRFAPQEGEGPAIEALLFRPATDRPAPAIVALHGCGGLRDTGGRLAAREADWAKRLTGEGFVVLFPDSFGSRGVGSQCRTTDRAARAWKERVADVRLAFDWLAGQSFVRAEAIGLLGWSNGGSTVLNAVRAGRAPSKGDFRTAVAFYPGCRPMAENPRWRARVETLILIGEADDWTPIEPCRKLVAAHPERLSIVAYPGAWHGFDGPGAPVRVRHGLAYTADGSGAAHVGTDPKARAEVLERVPAWFSARLK
jgi:dienelactone hydrolase